MGDTSTTDLISLGEKADMQQPKGDASSISELLQTLGKHTPFGYRQLATFTPFQRWTFWGTIVLFIISVGMRFLPPRFPAGAVFFLLLAQVSNICFLISSMLPTLRSTFQPLKSFLKAQEKFAQSDYLLAQELSDRPELALKFVSLRLRSEADHLKTRIGVIIGSLEKVGMLPLLLSVALTLWKFTDDGKSHAFPIAWPYVYLIVAALIALYFFGLVMLLVSHRVEELAEIVDTALEQQERSQASAALS